MEIIELFILFIGSYRIQIFFTLFTVFSSYFNRLSVNLVCRHEFPANSAEHGGDGVAQSGQLDVPHNDRHAQASV